MLRIVNEPVKFGIFVFILLFSSSSWGQGQFKKGLSGHEFWFYKYTGQLRNVTEDEVFVNGEYRTRHGFIPFKTKREIINIPSAKAEGAMAAFEHMVAFLRNRSPGQPIKHALQVLRALTDLKLEPEEWIRWYEENKNHLVWSQSLSYIVIDAKTKR